MKLAYVEVAGFRGFKEPTRFDFPGGFVVLTGRNGAGKSTVLDAIDFLLTGTINKYEVKGAKGGGLDSHIWWVGDGAPEKHYVSAGFISPNGREIAIRRSRESGSDFDPKSLGGELCSAESLADSWPETLIQTTLIRDETLSKLSLDLPEQARFAAVRAAIGGLTGPDHSQRTTAIHKAASGAKTNQEARLAEAQAELGRTLSALTEARSVAERQTDVSEAESIIAELAADLLSAAGDRAEHLRRRIADRKQSIAVLAEGIEKAARLQSEDAYFASQVGQAELANVQAERDSARQQAESAKQLLDAAEERAATERESDSYAAHIVALLDHGEAIGLEDGHCPLCNAERTEGEFSAAINSARARLSARGERAAQMLKALQEARAKAEQATAELVRAEQKLTDLEARRDRLVRELAAVREEFRQFEFEGDPSNPEAARRLVLERQSATTRLEHALFILETSGAHDRVTALEGTVERLRAQVDEEQRKVTAAERAVEAARQIDNAAKSVANEVLTEQFDTVMPLLKELYQRLRPHTDWREIETDFGGHVRASLNFTVGDGRNPQFLFSSGQRRAAGLAFLLAIHLSRPWCRLQTLLLDDPVQHIDDYRALNLVEVLSAVRRSGRQIVIAVEDPALADLLCRRLRSTVDDIGRRFELGIAKDGSAAIQKQVDIFPLPREVLLAEAS